MAAETGPIKDQARVGYLYLFSKIPIDQKAYDKLVKDLRKDPYIKAMHKAFGEPRFTWRKLLRKVKLVPLSDHEVAKGAISAIADQYNENCLPGNELRCLDRSVLINIAVSAKHALAKRR